MRATLQLLQPRRSSTQPPRVSLSRGISLYSPTASSEQPKRGVAVARPAVDVSAPGDSKSAADRTRRRITVRLLPFLFILYIVNYLDRTSVAYAALGMSRELGFSDRVLGLGAGIFFISYVALQIPGALLVERWSARRLIAAAMTVWGSMTALTGLVSSPGELYLARFLLGAAEASFFPGVVVYLSHWFVRQDRAKASSRFMAAIPLSFVIGSPLAGWILSHRWLGIAGWRWLFMLEGLPAIFLGTVAFFYLTDWPREAVWLSPEGRQWVEQKLEEEKPAHKRPVTVWAALGSGMVLLLAAAAFFDYFVEYSFVFWFPTLLKRQSGLSDLWVGLLGSVPYAAAFAAMLIAGWHSDRTGERRWHSAIPQIIAGIALACLLVLPYSTPVMVVHTGVRHFRLPSGLLGDAHRAAQRVSRRGGGGNDQRRCQHRGLCRPLRVWISEHSHRFCNFRADAHDGGRLGGRSTGAARSGNAAFAVPVAGRLVSLVFAAP
ncbi:MAG: MFS transporter [Acidobacteria bacterium]|nr:MAG: MFS transporter [Acidobacteriota bacterium]